MKIINLIGEKFGRLQVIERADNPGTRKKDTAAYWLCLCSCGKKVIIRGYSLRTGKTKSCGCLNNECSHLDEYKKPKYSHQESAAKKIWKRSNRYVQIPFTNFIYLIQQPCYYCGSSPNLVKESRRKESQKFYHGTLDRIDSSKDHTLDNVVPCCLTCNRAKLTRSLQEFKKYLNKLKDYQRKCCLEYRDSSPKIKIETLDKQYVTAIKMTYLFYRKDKGGELSLQQFYNLTQMNCYYCGEAPQNIRKYKLAKTKSQYYIYNGLDRIDNSLLHDYDNVVPCCKYCNSAKGELTLAEFELWIQKFK